MPKLIDIHTHLSCPDFDIDRAEVLTRAWLSCDAFIDIGAGTSKDAMKRAQNLAESDPRIFFTAGIHPHDAESWGSDSEILGEIEKSLAHAKCVAVGECGLDYYYDHSPSEAQKKIFQWHIEQAEKTKLPLMIHTRDAEADSIQLLKDYRGSAIFHCFTGTQELADFGVSKNFFVSFSGIVTFKNAESLRTVFKTLPIENILIETDSPYLAPVPLRGKRNETAFIEHTAEFLSGLRGLSLDEFAQQMRVNSLRAFPKIKLN